MASKTGKTGRSDRRQVQRVSKTRTAQGQRDDLNRVIDLLNKVLDTQRIQFQRIAQIQAELDHIKQTLDQLKPEGLTKEHASTGSSSV